MVVSTHTLDPERTSGSGSGASAETPTETQALALLDAELGGQALVNETPPAALRSRVDPVAQIIDRANRPGYNTWIRHVTGVGACTRPVRLRGRVHVVDKRTGEIVSTHDTADRPDGVIYTACGNRRATVCPACAETYRRDAYQLVRAGLVGGKTVPESVAQHPCLFVTLTAPSFGVVHTGPDRHGNRRLCRPRRKVAEQCPHGIVLACHSTHAEDDRALGTPLCPACFDYPAVVVWNAHVGELWRRTTIAVRRRLDRLAKAHGVRVRVSFGKVAEYQARGSVHLHALFRLDGIDPGDQDAIVPPPAEATAKHLEHAIRSAVDATWFATLPHSLKASGWDIRWGPQVDVRPVRDPGGEITEGKVAGYLAKYATKSTEAVGLVSTRITAANLDIYADPRTHAGQLIRASWRLGGGRDLPESYKALRRWAHMLGFGGHFFTKSRRYSVTFGTLRAARRVFRRRQAMRRDHFDEDTTLVVNTLSYAGTGWHTTGDAELAASAAARARERQHAAREELACTT